jgi:hypothetical protein
VQPYCTENIQIIPKRLCLNNIIFLRYMGYDKLLMSIIESEFKDEL